MDDLTTLWLALASIERPLSQEGQEDETTTDLSDIVHKLILGHGTSGHDTVAKEESFTPWSVKDPTVKDNVESYPKTTTHRRILRRAKRLSFRSAWWLRMKR